MISITQRKSSQSCHECVKWSHLMSIWMVGEVVYNNPGKRWFPYLPKLLPNCKIKVKKVMDLLDYLCRELNWMSFFIEFKYVMKTCIPKFPLQIHSMSSTCLLYTKISVVYCETYTFASKVSARRRKEKFAAKVTFRTSTNVFNKDPIYLTDRSGVWRLSYGKCECKNAGTTSEKKTRFKEHTNSYRKNYNASLFSKHILNFGHDYDAERLVDILLVKRRSNIRKIGN